MVSRKSGHDRGETILLDDEKSAFEIAIRSGSGSMKDDTGDAS